MAREFFRYPFCCKNFRSCSHIELRAFWKILALIGDQALGVACRLSFSIASQPCLTSKSEIALEESLYRSGQLVEKTIETERTAPQAALSFGLHMLHISCAHNAWVTEYVSSGAQRLREAETARGTWTGRRDVTFTSSSSPAANLAFSSPDCIF